MKTILHYLIMVLVMTSCQFTKETKTEILNRILTTDQSKISYTIYGQGEMTLLFVHGWNINKSYWDVQQKQFGGSYQVVTMDLPGFGESINLADEYSIASYANDVKALIKQLELKNVILIGHSMGGRIILEAAQQNKEVIALVGVDNYKEVRQKMTDELQAEADGFVEWLQIDFANNSSLYVDQYLIHAEADSAVRARIVSDYRNASPDVAIPAIESYLNYAYAEQERLSNLDVPLYLISSNMSPVDTVGLQNTELDYKVYEMRNTGHFPMVEQPEEFNRLLTKVLGEIKITKE